MERGQQRRPRRIATASFAAVLALILGLFSIRSFASSASLTVSPGTARQNDTVTLTGVGFQPNEIVSVWITYPDFAVFGVADVETNGDGNFSYPYLLDFLGATFTPTGKYTYTAFGKSSGRIAFADLQVEIDNAPPTSQGVTMHVTPGRDSQGSYFSFRGDGFGPNETLALWLRYPDNSVGDLGQITAGPGGVLDYTLYASGAPIGRYAFTGYGLTTGRTGIAEFDLTVDDLTIATGTANLRVSPRTGDQRSFALFEGSGFQPKEIVSIWVTLPDFSTLFVGDVYVGDEGAFIAELYLGETEPVGKRSYTAYGNSSGLRAISEITLEPGGLETIFDDPAQEDQFDIILPEQPSPDPVEEITTTVTVTVNW
jgi:hypothetical protein